MKHRRLLRIVAVAGVIFLVTHAGARASYIDPADALAVRYFHGELYSLLGLSIKMTPNLEDRSILEFDVSALSGTIPLATLDLGIQDQDPGGPVGIIDVFTYIGDGEVTLDEFYAGEWFTDFPFNEDRGMAFVDVTSFVQDAVDAGEQFIGFRLSTDTTDRYFLGSIVHMPEPVLTIVPEPGAVAMVLLGGMVILRRRGSSPDGYRTT